MLSNEYRTQSAKALSYPQRTFVTAGKKTANLARAESKGALILQVVGRAKGATLTEIMTATR